MRFHALGAVVLAVVTAQAGSSQQPTFRSGVDYVRVDVVVTDKDDRPITDLTKNDFSILDHDRPQAIDSFQFMSVPVEHRTVEVNEADAPPSDVATNVAPSPNSRLFAIVVDDLHLIEADIVPLKRVLMDLLASLSPDDDVAIVFVGRSNLSVNFTRDTARLRAAVEHVRDAMGFGLDALAQEPNGSATAGASSGVIIGRPAGNRANYARSAAFVLKNTAAALAGSGHARRAIVYVSGGTTVKPFPTAKDSNYSPEFRDDLLAAFDAARRADVPIYTLDPRGAVTPEEAIRGGIGVIHSAAIREQIADNIQVQQDYMSTVAINTGGRAFTNISDLPRAVREIVGENGSYYLLGYYPAPFERDGKFHSISVHVNRPGVRVRARAGYVASKDTSSTADAKPMLDAAMSAGVNVSGIALHAVAAPVTVAPKGKGMTTVVTVEVTYPAPTDDSHHIDDTLQMSVLALDADGKVKGSSDRTLHFTGTTQGEASVTFFIDDVIEVPSQPLTLRVGLASRSLGKAGSVQLPLVVPKPSDSKLQLSGVMLGFAGPSREAAMHADLLAGLVPFQPTTTRVFTADDTLRVYGHAFWGAKDSIASATLTVSGPVRIPPTTTTVTAPRANGRAEGTFDATLPLTGLTAAKYALSVDVRLPSGESARRVVSFEVQ